MRSIAFLALALTALLGLAANQPAAAWDDSHHRGADVYVHHHVYAPVRRIKHVYHIHRPGPSHVHVVHYAGNPYLWSNSRGYFMPRYHYRWRGHHRHW